LLDRQIRGIQREEEKVKLELKKAAKRGDRDVCLVLAKEMVNSRKAVNRIHTSKAQLNSVMMNMSQQLATLRVANAMEKSTSVMKSMQSLVKIQEISHVMQEMSREMMKAGIIEEMIEETLDDQLDVDDTLEEEAQKEVDKVLWELTAGQLGAAPAAVSDTLPSVGEASAAPASASAVDEDEDISEMQQRLQALRS
ncbi:unnamed protein product, partial [Medioppia subpectinata]